MAELDADVREKVVGNITKLNKADSDLEEIKKDGYEAAGLFKKGKRELYEQRELIDEANRNQQRVVQDVTKTGKRVKTIARREFCYKVILYFLIMCLTATYIVYIIIRLS